LVWCDVYIEYGRWMSCFLKGLSVQFWLGILYRTVNEITVGIVSSHAEILQFLIYVNGDTQNLKDTILQLQEDVVSSVSVVY
jgi:hypothetical protein